MLDQVGLLLGGEGKVQESFGLVMESYTKAVSELIGDANGWLDWFWLENDLGRRGLHVLDEGAKRSISTVDDLVWLVGVTA